MKTLKNTIPLLMGLLLTATISFGQIEQGNTMTETKITYDKDPGSGNPTEPPTSLGMEKSERTSFSVFPNPAKNMITITHPVYDAPQVVRIYDLVGHVVLTFTIEINENTRSQIDLSNLRSGVYVVMLKNRTTKLSIQ